MATRKFVDDFETVSMFYKLRELGEYETAKQSARQNMENAVATFAALANEVREDIHGE